MGYRTLATVLIVVSSLLTRFALGAAPDDGLVGHWTFDAPAANVAQDASGHGWDAKVVGPSAIERKLGGALAFDGVDDYVALGDLGQFEAVTVAFWMKGAKLDADEGFHGLVTSDAWEEGVIHLPVKGGKVDVYLHLGEKARGRLTSRPLKNNTQTENAITCRAG